MEDYFLSARNRRIVHSYEDTIVLVAALVIIVSMASFLFFFSLRTTRKVWIISPPIIIRLPTSILIWNSFYEYIFILFLERTMEYHVTVHCKMKHWIHILCWSYAVFFFWFFMLHFTHLLLTPQIREKSEKNNRQIYSGPQISHCFIYVCVCEKE